jgi:hypothetical protein
LEKDPFELDPAGVGEEQGWIVLGNQGGTFQNGVVVFFEKIQKFRADFMGGHDGSASLLPGLTPLQNFGCRPRRSGRPVQAFGSAAAGGSVFINP